VAIEPRKGGIMRRIFFPALVGLSLFFSPVVGDTSSSVGTCYFVVENRPAGNYSYYLFARDDLLFMTSTGEFGDWGRVGSSPMFFEFWYEGWNYPYHFLSGTKKMGVGQYLDIEAGTYFVCVYTLKKVKQINCGFAATGEPADKGPSNGTE
jgi:hypothetical protein